MRGKNVILHFLLTKLAQSGLIEGAFVRAKKFGS